MGYGSVDQIETVKPESVGPTAASSPRLLVLEVKEVREPTLAKQVRVIESRVNVELQIELQDDWAQTDISASHIARVILTSKCGTYFRWCTDQQKSGTIIINSAQNFFIAHPDTLVSGTAVSDSFRCLRKSVISAKCPPPIDAESTFGEAALFGSMIHNLFQNVLILDSNTRDYSTMQELSQRGGLDIMSFFEIVEDIVNNHVNELFAASIPLTHAREVLHKIIPQIVTWYETFMGFGNFHTTPGVPVAAGKKVQNVVVTKVHDIEELVWSPVLGLKGKIDASVHLRIDEQDCGIAVLELKSGKSIGYTSVSHSAQVSLYNLLLSDRNDAMIKKGLLTYIRYKDALQAVREGKNASQSQPVTSAPAKVVEGGMDHRLVVSVRAESIALLMQRNRLASHLRMDADIEDLPPLLQGQPETCNMCFASDSCLLQHKLLGTAGGDSVEGGPGLHMFHQKTSHLTPLHASYYKFWRDVLADEEEYAARNSRYVWAMEASRKEAVGKCLSNLELLPEGDSEYISPHQLLSPGQRTIVKFKRHGTMIVKSSLLGCGVSIGDFVVISAQKLLSENGVQPRAPESLETWQCALTNGFVQSLTTDWISVSVDRSLVAWALHQGVRLEQVFWRIDAEEIYASHTTAKRTLEALFFNEEAKEGATRLRQLIVDRKEPLFRQAVDADVDDIIHKSEDTDALNEEQKYALSLSFRAIDYLLILGMPGTGKTATLASIVITHAKRGQSVLLCSHTNAAVDNLLRRLIALGFDDFVRLGRNINVIDSKIRPFHMSGIIERESCMSDVEKVAMAKQVVATTCLGINHWVLQRRKKFDVVVVDEASQMLQPICIGPLQFTGGCFVLVGDHYQLAPLQRANEKSGRRQNRQVVASGQSGLLHKVNDGGEEKAKDWMEESTWRSDESLFRRLCERRPEAMVLLSKQYRMARDIMSVCNEIVYGGSLRCVSEEIAEQKLKTECDGDNVADVKKVKEVSNMNEERWLEAVRDCNRRVVFIDTGQRGDTGNTKKMNGTAGKTGAENEVENHVEAKMIARSVKELVAGGVNLSAITVLTPFRAQVALIRMKLKQEDKTAGCEVSTVDQFQGKDNNCVIVSFVQSGDGGVGPLLRDWRRVNVALTRAKQKLILVGCAHSLSRGSHFLQHLMQFLSSNGMMMVSAHGHAHGHTHGHTHGHGHVHLL